jgi:type VI secretion system protein ImpL
MQARTLGILLFLLTSLFIGFSWWVYVSSQGKLHWAIPVMCTVVPIVIALAVFLFQRMSAHRGAKGLEQALAADGARQQGRQVSTVRNAEVERLRREFDRAVGALKQSKLARGTGSAADALYRLPWYTIIGPPACGKTTVLRNSGLKFPHLAGTGDRLKGIGGTRNCDWWLTNQAILLDTAGRWTLEEDDRDEWDAFLDLLKKNRPGRPLNGVIAAISLSGDDATSIAGVDIAGVKALAGRMRERLDEITGRLGLELPVYLLFTKCDLISGFVETFGSLTPAERRQIWGFTAPILKERTSSPGTYFQGQFEGVCNALEHYALSRMSTEVRADTISRIYEFPAQLRVLSDKLSIFVDELFEESAYGEAPFLRGAYFTSGTQEGAPADLLLEEMGAMNVRPVGEENEGEKKSYFLHDMLMNVVFQDRDMATASHSELLRQQKRRRAWTSGLFAAAALLAIFPTFSCRQNLDSLARTRSLVAKAQDGVSPDTNATVPGKVAELAALDEEVQRYEEGMPSLLSGFGLYQGDDLREPLARYYSAALKEWAVRPLLNRSNEILISITQQLEGLRAQGAGSLRIDENSRAALSNSLKLHLLLTTPREECIPKPLARKDWLLGRMMGLWERGAPAKDKLEVAQRKALVLDYLELLSGDQAAELSLGKDKRRVELARAAVGGEDRGGQLLNGVLERFAKDQRDLTALTGASSVLTAGQGVHGAFTVDAWRQASREFNSPKAWSTSDESWVLGCQKEGAEEARVAQNSAAFQGEYLRRYADHWRKFLEGLSARSPSSPVEAETMLSELVGRPGVLGNLFLRVKENTELPPATPGDVQGSVLQAAGNALKGAAAQNAKIGALAGAAGADEPNPALDQLKRSFADFVRFGVPTQPGMETPLDQYRRQVETVLLALKAYKEDDTKIEDLGKAVRSALDNVEMLLSTNASPWSGRLRELLIPPLAGIINISMHDRGGIIQRAWCQQVFRPYQEDLGGRYPISVESGTSSSLQAFQRFFAPNTGTLWAFASGSLGAYVSLEGDRYRFTSTGADGRGLFREELISFLNRAVEVRRSFFPEGSATVRMPYRMRVRGAAGFSVTSFSVGTKTVRYDAGAEVWTPMEWPGEQPSAGATLAVTPYQGAGPRPLTIAGEWGLFMILDERHGHSQILERSERQITAGWKPKGSQHWIKIDFATEDPRAPLMSVPFGRAPRNVLPLAVPARITHAGSGC